MCPILERFKVLRSIRSVINRREVVGSSPPSVFIGEYGYPNVKAGILIPPMRGDTSYLDNPLRWENVSIGDILYYRSILVMGERRINVYSRFQELQELAASIKPVDCEAKLERKPNLKILSNGFSPPISPTAPLLSFKVFENPKIPRKVDKIIFDEVKAKDAVTYLYNCGFNDYYIVRLFSAGLLGVEKRLVPTRWSITAVQDIVADFLRKRISTFESIDEFELYFCEFLGNRYSVLLIPGNYSFELLEVWLRGSIFGSENPRVLCDYEDRKGLKRYPDETLGAYHAARLSVLEYLRSINRQARVIVFREITPNYYLPVGVWQIRVGVRKALRNKIGVFDDLSEVLAKLKELLLFPLKKYIERSKILGQRTLSSYV